MPTYKYLNDTGLERTLSKLKTYIDSQSGGGSDGHGFIICDTSTMQVGDRIRVRSVYTVLEEPYNQTKEVVTVGQPVVFTVPCYDYYKICTVQTINDTPTEIGGVYKTVDYGQTLFVDNVLDKTALQGMQGILNAHNELAVYNIGDEVKTTINDGTVKDWIMQVGRIDGENHAIDLVSKYIWSTSIWAEGYNSAYYNTYIKAKADVFYSQMIESDKQYIKEVTKPSHSSASSANFLNITTKIWLPSRKEAVNSYATGGTPIISQTQLPIFTTQANRIRTYNGTATDWWTCDGQSYDGSSFVFYVTYAGNDNGSNGARGTSRGILPCFTLKADS